MRGECSWRPTQCGVHKDVEPSPAGREKYKLGCVCKYVDHIKYNMGLCHVVMCQKLVDSTRALNECAAITKGQN